MKSLRSLARTRAFWLHVLFIIAVVFVILLAITLTIFSLKTGMYMTTYPTDGTFQLYNPLRRLLLGQAPGFDFPLFHGVGVAWLHFPLFTLLGHNLFAAETAKWFVSPALFMITAWTFFYAFFRDHKKAIVALGVTSAIASLYLFTSFYPSNSLISIRTTFPLLVGAILLWETKRSLRITKSWKIPFNVLWAVPLLGLSFVCGTEQGVGAIMAFTAVRAYGHFKANNRWFVALGRAAAELFVVIVTALIALFIATKGHATSALHYAFVDIPTDQGWYFGAPPNLYLSWHNIFSPISYAGMDLVGGIIAASLAVLYLAKKYRMLSPSKLTGIAFLIIYGIIVFAASSTGYFLPSAHLIPLQRGVLLAGIAVIILWLYTAKPRQLKGRIKQYYRQAPAIVIGGLCLFLVVQIGGSAFRLISYKPFEVIAVARDMRKSGDRASLSLEWSRRANDILPHIPAGSRVWSAYTGAYDGVLGQLNPSHGGEDYIIHALGDERRNNYNSQFIHDKPAYVITMRPAFFIYEEWLWSGHWAFYDQLFTHYDIEAKTDSHILWKYRADSSDPSPAAHEAVPKTGNSWKLPDNTTAEPKVYEVTVTYKASARLGLQQFNRLPRYLVNARNTGTMYCPISLPPAHDTWTFPVAILAGHKNISLDPEAAGILPTASLTISSVSYREVIVPTANKFVFNDNTVSTKMLDAKRDTCRN